jgi:hypothetical protein
VLAPALVKVLVQASEQVKELEPALHTPLPQK